MNGTTTIHYHIVLLYVLLPPHSSLYPQPSGLLNQTKNIGPCYDKVSVDSILSSVVLDKNAAPPRVVQHHSLFPRTHARCALTTIIAPFFTKSC